MPWSWSWEKVASSPLPWTSTYRPWPVMTTLQSTSASLSST